MSEMIGSAETWFGVKVRGGPVPATHVWRHAFLCAHPATAERLAYEYLQPSEIIAIHGPHATIDAALAALS